MDESSIELTTDRFLLRAIDREDAPELHAIWTKEDIRRFLWDGNVVSLDQTRDIATQNSALFEERGFGIWGIREHGSETLLGISGFWHFRDPPSLELLFCIDSTQWSQGVATESSRAVMLYAFETLGFDKIDASTDVGNAASRRALEKLRIPFQRQEVVDGADTVFFQAEKAAWLRGDV